VDITEPTKDGWGPLLLVVYVISQLTSTWLMSTSMQSAAQRWLIMLLPIFFIPFILGFPSGLMIYWLTTNLWSTGQGIVTRRQMPRPVAPPKRTSRTPPKPATAAAAVDGGASSADEAVSPARTGPPRRVKRRKGGGGRRR
jgi:YidC/Oxa1 family membrane protein insertase